MKKIVLFVLLSNSVIAFATLARGARAENTYAYCLECTGADVIAKIRAHYQAIIPTLALECPIGDLSCADGSEIVLADDWLYFTDTGTNKGLKYNGTVNQMGKITVFPAFLLTQADKGYFTDMSNLRAQVKVARDELQARMDESSDVTEPQAKKLLASGKTFLTNKVDGDCVSFSSPFDYFNNAQPRRTNADGIISANLVRNASRIDKEISGFSISFGSSGISASISGVITETYGDNHQYFSNGGSIVYDVTRDSQGRWGFQVNLDKSQVGLGLFGDAVNGATPMSVFMERVGGSYVPVKGSTPAIEDPCVAEDYEEMLEENGYVVTAEDGQGSEGAYGGGDFQRCDNIQRYDVPSYITLTVYYTRYVQRPDGTFYFVLDPHDIIFQNNDVAGVERMCGAGSFPGPGGT